MVTEEYTGERKRVELEEGGRHRRWSVCAELRPMIRREGGEGHKHSLKQTEERFKL